MRAAEATLKELVLHVSPPRGCAIVLTELKSSGPTDPNWVDSFKQSIEHAHLDPAIIAPFRRLIRPKALRKITPTRARARYPQQRVKETSAIAARTALAFTAARNELLDLLPLIIPKYFAFQSRPSKSQP